MLAANASSSSRKVTNYSTGEHLYVYMLKKKFKKLANRLITVLYHLLRRVKWGSHPCRFAKDLILIADNASENKNNVLFVFCSELVLRGWFRSVSMLFGPVGHTHNGIDAYHFCHNQLVGNFVSITLAEYIHRFQDAWRTERTRPRPVILETQYDWSAVYGPLTHRVAGFSKSTRCENPCRAFQFRMAEGVVEMKVKTDPCQAKYTGADNDANGRGFVLLRGIPTSVPQETPPSLRGFGTSYAQRLDTPAMRRACRAAGKERNFEWILECARTGTVSSLGRVDLLDKGKALPEDRAAWGHVERLGFGACWKDVEVIRRTEFATNLAEFWRIPEEVNCLEGKVQGGLDVGEGPAPTIRYADQPPKSQPDKKRKKTTKQRKPKARRTAATQFTKILKKAREKAGDASSSEEEDVNSEDLVETDKEEENSQEDEDDEEIRASDSDNDENNQGNEEISWGADFSLCRVGHFAVVSWRDDGKGEDRQQHDPEREVGHVRRGICVVKIRTVSTQDNTFTAASLQCTAAHTSTSCISGKWHLPRSPITETWSNNSAAGYFEKLKSDSSLPAFIRKVLDSAQFVE
jgi:hypothetical protein